MQTAAAAPPVRPARDARPTTSGERAGAEPRRAPAPLMVQVVEDHWGFTALRFGWADLLRASSAEQPFLTWEWLQTWWTRLGGARHLRLVVVRAGQELVAVAPLRLVPGRLPWLSRLEFLGTGEAGSDYLDLIIRRGREAESLAAIARYVRAQRLALWCAHLPADSHAARLAALLAPEGWTTETRADGTCPVIPLDGHSWDSFLATLGSSHRANVRRRLKALHQQHDVRFDRVTADEERRALLPLLERWHDARYVDRGGSSAFTPEMRAFQEQATRRALSRGWLRMYVLRLDGEAVAVMYGFALGGRFYFYQHGFDDRYKAQSVGLVLMALTIRAALDEGLREFDMLWGVEPYKFLWARQSRALQRLELYPPHLGGRLHRLTRTAERGARRLARRVLTLGVTRGT